MQYALKDIPYGQSGHNHVQTTNNEQFFILEGPCPPVQFKRSGEKVFNAERCSWCYRCRGGNQ